MSSSSVSSEPQIERWKFENPVHRAAMMREYQQPYAANVNLSGFGYRDRQLPEDR